MTAVYVPYTDLAPGVAEALRPDAPRYRWTGDDERQYWWLLRGLWQDGEPFTIVEHDVIPPAGAVAEMWGCPEDWCAVPYPCGGIVTTALGCTKFEAPLLARYPDLVERLPDAARAWHSLDNAVIGELHRRGEREHVHTPPAEHLHGWRSAKEAITLAHLRYIGDGSRYLHEDAAHGIPPIPPADFETDDPRVISVAVGSGLYIEAAAPDTIRKGRSRVKDEAPAEDADPAEDTATTAE